MASEMRPPETPENHYSNQGVSLICLPPQMDALASVILYNIVAMIWGVKIMASQKRNISYQAQTETLYKKEGGGDHGERCYYFCLKSTERGVGGGIILMQMSMLCLLFVAGNVISSCVAKMETR